MTTPQIIMGVLLIIEYYAGNKRLTDKYPNEPGQNFWCALLRVGILFGILWWGGFWL